MRSLLLDRREFFSRMGLGGAGMLAGAGLAPPLQASPSLKTGKPGKAPAGKNDLGLLKDETYWARVGRCFSPPEEFINFENGYYSMPPNCVVEAVNEDNRWLNHRASYYKRRERIDDMNTLAGEVATFVGAPVESIVITRNTTESLNAVIAGLMLEPGDEIVHAELDYGAMQMAMRLKARRDGVALKSVSVPIDPASDDEVLAVYQAAVTPRTKVFHIPHMINVTGHVLPVRKLCDWARDRGIETIVDSAHSLSHIDFRVDDLGCDFMGSSLHKWTCAPLGTGLLYIRPGKVERLWPYVATDRYADDDIRKMRHVGTIPEATYRGIREAMAFHQAIGGKLKQERLRYIRELWMEPLRNVSGVVLHTPTDRERTGAIGNVGIEGMSPKELADRLLDRYGVYTVAIGSEKVPGVRVTPHLYTTPEECARLKSALLELASV